MSTKYTIKKQIFFNWYFKNTSKEDIASFISPYFLNIVNNDVHFSLDDLLKSSQTVPSYVIDDYPTNKKPNVNVDVIDIKLV